MLVRLMGVLAVVALVVAGCGKSSSDVQLKGETDAGLPPEAVAVRAAFADADPSFKNPVNEILKLVKAGATSRSAYAEAMPQVLRLASNPQVSAEQKQALEKLAERLKSDLTM